MLAPCGAENWRGSNQFETQSQNCCGCPIIYAQLVEYVNGVAFNRVRAQAKHARNGGIGMPLRYESRDFNLSGAEGGERLPDQSIVGPYSIIDRLEVFFPVASGPLQAIGAILPVGHLETHRDHQFNLHAPLTNGINPDFSPPRLPVRQSIIHFPLEKTWLSGSENVSHGAHRTRFFSLLVELMAEYPGTSTLGLDPVMPDDSIFSVHYVAVKVDPPKKGVVEEFRNSLK